MGGAEIKLLTSDLNERQLSVINKSIARALQPMRVQLPMRCSEWAAEHFYLSAESSGVSGKFEAWPFQPAILDCMGSDEIAVLSFLKSARISYTKMLSCATGYYHHHKSRNVVIYQPTDSDAKKYTKETINPMIRDVSVLGELLAKSSQNNKDNTLDSKFFLGSSLHILGGTSPNNFRRLTKDVVIYDELDGFATDVGGEGDPVSLGDKRVRDSSFPKSIRGTTPTIAGRSLIQKSIEDADLEFRYEVECVDCQAAQYMNWGGPDADYGIKWHDDDPETAYYQCNACDARWDYSELMPILETGVWRSSDGHWIDKESKLRNAADEIIPWVRHVGFVLWAAYSPTFPWSEIVREFLATKGDAVKLKAFVNTTLGELWKETAIAVEHEPLLERRESYRSIPDEVRAITFGIDVQANRFELEFAGWGPYEESWSLDYVVIDGDTQRPEVWKLLAKELSRSFKFADGKKIYPVLGCMDSGYLTDDVYKFCRRMGSRFVIPIKGDGGINKAIVTMPRKPSKDTKIALMIVGTEMAKEVLYKRLQMESAGPGYCHFPDSEPYDEEYFRQLTAHEKRVVKRGGKERWMYEKAYIRDEAMDCKVYNLAAIKLAQQRYRLDLTGEVSPGVKKVFTDDPREIESQETHSLEDIAAILNG